MSWFWFSGASQKRSEPRRFCEAPLKKVNVLPLEFLSPFCSNSGTAGVSDA